MSDFYIKISGAFLFILTLYGCTNSGDQYLVSEERANKGKELFKNDGCVTCHSLTGEIKYGPSLNNILHTRIEVIREGKIQTIIVDRKYLTRSIYEPDYEKVEAFKNKKMPKPQISLEDINHLVDYLIFVNNQFQGK